MEHAPLTAMRIFIRTAEVFPVDVFKTVLPYPSPGSTADKNHETSGSSRVGFQTASIVSRTNPYTQNPIRVPASGRHLLPLHLAHCGYAKGNRAHDVFLYGDFPGAVAIAGHLLCNGFKERLVLI